MKQIIFSTGNRMKLGQATTSCALFGVEIIHKKLDIDEMQSHDPMKIAINKAREAYRQVDRPLIINDTFWAIPALSGFPGGYMKDVAQWFSSEDFIKLMQGKDDRSVLITDCIIYKDDKIEKTIKKEFWGEIADEPRGNGNSIENVAVFGGMTLAENNELNGTTLGTDENIWSEFSKWYLEYDN